MKKVGIVTDSNSGISQREAEALGVHVLPMPFMMEGNEYFEGISLSQEEFYIKLGGGMDIATSQPSPDSVLRFWEKLLKEYEALVVIPMSSGLSSTCDTAQALSADYEGRVYVVDNQRISVTQRQATLDAKALADQGMAPENIVDALMESKMDSSIYIMVDTMKYLKKGGRVTPAAATIGEILRIKPVLQIHGEKLDAFAKARNVKQAKNIMLNAIKKDITDNLGRIPEADAPDAPWIAIAYTYDVDEAKAWQEELAEHFPGYKIHIDPLSLSVACHIGPGALAITWSKKIV